jgi:hypothetical protein
MTPSGFLRRVTADAAGLLAALAVVSSWIGGGQVGLGVLAGGALSVGNLWWLSRRVIRMADLEERPGAPRALPSVGGVWGVRLAAPHQSSIGIALRLVAVTAIVAVVLASGLGHPVGVVAGLTVLPCALIARGLRSAREVSAPWR